MSRRGKDPAGGVEPVEPWEQRRGESPQAYEAFRVYLELGDKRSQPKVAERVGKDVSLISRWGSANEWVSRCEAWARHEKAVADRAHMMERARVARRWERRKLRHNEKIWALLERFRDRLAKMLDHPLTETQYDPETGESRVVPVKWNDANVQTCMRMIDELSRTAITEALDDDFDPLTATPEECQAYLTLQAEKRKAARSGSKEGPK